MVPGSNGNALVCHEYKKENVSLVLVISTDEEQMLIKTVCVHVQCAVLSGYNQCLFCHIS